MQMPIRLQTATIAATWAAGVLAACVTICSALPAAAAAFDAYHLVETFNFPTIAAPADQGPVVFDSLSDGRLLGVSTLITDPDFSTFLGAPKVYLETAPDSRVFNLLGDLPLPGGAKWDAGGGAFLRVSQGGSGPVRIAVGNNRTDTPLVGVFTESDLISVSPLSSLPISWYAVDHFDAAWADDRYLAINSGNFITSQVNLLDTDSPTATPDNPLVLSGVAGASGGVGFDAAGDMVVGNGFASGSGSATGTIKQFDQAAWQAAIGGTPLDFETDGSLVATVLGGGSLVFDVEGSLLVGGSDFFGGGESDFFALLPGPGLGTVPRTFDPDTAATSYYVLGYNRALGEIYAYEPFALDFPANIDNTLVFVLSAASAAAVPEAATLVLGIVALVGSLLLRPNRRRL